MSKRQRRLGRGLDSLITDLRSATIEAKDHEHLADRQAMPDASGKDTVNAIMIDIEELRPNPLQPRSIIDDDDIASLASSIQQNGILQPVTVRLAKGKYQIIAGERRWRAARVAGLSQIPVVVRQATDEQMLELALIENLQREDLNAIDRAKAYKEFSSRFNLRPEMIASRLGEDRTTVINYMRLLDLEEDIQDLVAQSTITMGHARCLLGVPDTDLRLELARATRENGWSVRALESIVRRKRSTPGDAETASHQPPLSRTAHLADLQRRFEERTKTKVVIREGKRKGTGRIILHYYSLDDFDRLSELLGVEIETQ